MGKTWENHRKRWEKTWESHGETYGKSERNEALNGRIIRVNWGGFVFSLWSFLAKGTCGQDHIHPFIHFSH